MPNKPPTHRPHGQTPENRPSACKRGYGRAHRRARIGVISGSLCVECEQRGFVEPATVLDHIVPHRGDPVLRDDPANMQPMCASCHGKKSARERMDR